MGAKPGQNRFAGYQKKRVRVHAAAIQTVLDEMPRGLKFNSSKALASHVAEQIGVHRTTVTRNTSYMKLILAAFAKRAVNLDEVDVNTADANILKELVALRDITISNQAQEIERLKAVIKNASSVESERPKILQSSDIETDRRINSIGTSFYKLIKHCEGEGLGLSYDRESNEITDLDGGDREVIVDSNQLKDFAEFLKSKNL